MLPTRITLVHLFLLLLFVISCIDGLVKSDVREHILTQFEIDEKVRISDARARGEQLDKRFVSSTPFITANGFRNLCYPHVVDYNYTLPSSLQCNISTAMLKAVPDGACVYIASACFNKVVQFHISLIPKSFSLVVHDGDQSIPDGQTDYQSGWLQQFETLPQLTRLHAQGKLIALHAQNLWWKKWWAANRPTWLHCLPIGLPMRKYLIGSNLTVYLEVIRESLATGVPLLGTHSQQLTKRPLLLVAFTPKSYAPDRGKALLSFFGKKKSFYTKNSFTHEGWLRAIVAHRFTLCPFGHGLDTHRLWEVLLLGGIPVVRRSSITSCIDDSDNVILFPRRGRRDSDAANSTDVVKVERGSIPIVVVNSWSEVTEVFLERKWRQLRHRVGGWDYSRILMEHWEARIMGPERQNRSHRDQL
mmetsp:Transcript_8247/g.15559  ORF Transcript_8247/g.15559 Transcript_8247/m.15559 type:complete len:417 (+) Transcript_8247:137-1387(+)